MHAKSLQSCPTLCDPMDYSPQVPLSMGFTRQEYWSRLPFPPPGDLPGAGIEPASLASPTLAGRLYHSTTCIHEASARGFDVSDLLHRLINIVLIS